MQYLATAAHVLVPAIDVLEDFIKIPCAWPGQKVEKRAMQIPILQQSPFGWTWYGIAEKRTKEPVGA